MANPSGADSLQQFPDYIYRFPGSDTFATTYSNLSVTIDSIKDNVLVMDIVGLKPFLVNALRQTILNDVPTLAIEEVYFEKNTSGHNSDYISQRLSLLPIRANPRDFKFPSKADPTKYNSKNTIVFEINEQNTEKEPKKVYSRSLIWNPIGENQKNLKQPIEPLFGNIPLLYLKSGEEISCRCYAIKGMGRVHSKFSAGLGSYAFHSKIDILKPVVDKETGLALQRSFPTGVICLNELSDGKVEPYVANARLDRHTRAFKNNEKVHEMLSVKYYRDHVIFTVESYGVLTPEQIVLDSLKLLIYKYQTWQNIIAKARSQ